MKHKRGVINMVEVKVEKDHCPCLSCMYLVQVTKINEEINGNYDLRINCAISGCPHGVSQKNTNSISSKKSEAHRKISDCIKMLERCIELKSKGRDELE